MRLLSLSPGHTELIYALGAEAQLVGVSGYCDWPEAALALPRVKGWSNADLEQVKACKPDLVLTHSVAQEKVATALKQAGIAVLHQDPRDLTSVAESWVELGLKLGLGPKSEALASDFLGYFAKLRRASQGQKRLRVYVEEWHAPPMVAGNWVPDLLEACGAEPFQRQKGNASEVVTWEEMLEFDPELVIYSICGVSLKFDPAEFLDIEGWNQSSAAKSGRVYSIDDSLFNRPGPRLMQGAELLAQLMRGEVDESQKRNCRVLERPS